MESKARIGKHPIHPMLIPFPLALWTGGFLFDLLGKFSKHPYHHQTAYYMIAVGCIFAVIAAIPGLIDLFGATAEGSEARRIGWTHAALNIAALLVFAYAVYTRHQVRNYINMPGWIAELIGVAIIGVSGWLGGSLVYEHRVGVVERQ